MHLVSERERGIISVLILHRIWSVDCCQQFTAQLQYSSQWMILSSAGIWGTSSQTGRLSTVHSNLSRLSVLYDFIGLGRNWNTWRQRQKSWEARFKAAIWNITWWDHKFPPKSSQFLFLSGQLWTAWVCGARGRADKIYLEKLLVVYPVMVFNVNQCPKALPLNCVTHPLASPQTRLVDRYIRNKAKPIPKTGANASLLAIKPRSHVPLTTKTTSL